TVVKLVGFPHSDNKLAFDVVSPLRKDLNAAVFSGSSVLQDESTCLSKSSVGLPEKYCIDGMERDQFVPLANDLNDSTEGDSEASWVHYLERANLAAIKADGLGSLLMDLGVNDPVRREQAAEEFAALWSVFPTEGSVSVVDGLL